MADAQAEAQATSMKKTKAISFKSSERSADGSFSATGAFRRPSRTSFAAGSVTAGSTVKDSKMTSNRSTREPRQYFGNASDLAADGGINQVATERRRATADTSATIHSQAVKYGGSPPLPLVEWLVNCPILTLTVVLGGCTLFALIAGLP